MRTEGFLKLVGGFVGLSCSLFVLVACEKSSTDLQAESLLEPSLQLEVGGLEDGQAPQLPVSATSLADGRIAVVDGPGRQVVIYSGDGEPLHSFGTYGQGPGEFETPVSVATLDDTVYVADETLMRVSAFTSKGELVSTIPLGARPSSIAFLDRKLVVGVTHSSLVVVLVDTSQRGHREVPILTYTSDLIGNATPRQTRSQPLLQKAGDDVVIMIPSLAFFVTLTSSLSLEDAFVLDAEETRVYGRSVIEANKEREVGYLRPVFLTGMAVLDKSLMLVDAESPLGQRSNPYLLVVNRSTGESLNCRVEADVDRRLYLGSIDSTLFYYTDTEAATLLIFNSQSLIPQLEDCRVTSAESGSEGSRSKSPQFEE